MSILSGLVLVVAVASVIAIGAAGALYLIGYCITSFANWIGGKDGSDNSP